MKFEEIIYDSINSLIPNIKIGKDNFIFAKKYKGKKTYFMWWEDSDMWFLNVSENKDLSESVFIIEKDLKSYLDFMFIKDNFKFYKIKE